MEYGESMIDIDVKSKKQKRPQDVCSKGQYQNQKLKRSKHLLKVSNDLKIRYNNLDKIEQDRQSAIPLLNLNESPLIVRRQHQMKTTISIIHCQDQLSPIQYTHRKMPLKKSQYVQEVDKAATKLRQYQQVDIHIDHKKVQKDVFKDYNRCKMLTSEYFVWVMFFIMLSIYKIYYYIPQALQL